MPGQVLILAPKLSRLNNQTHGSSLSDRHVSEQSDSYSDASSFIDEQKLSPKPNQLLTKKAHLVMRITPPQPVFDSSFDWDEEDQPFGARSSLTRRQRSKLNELHARNHEGFLKHPNLSSIISAPSIDLGFGFRASNISDYTMSSKRDAHPDVSETQGQTLLHLAAKLGHEDVMRILICETSHADMLLNTRGQTPLLCAIEYGSTSTAALLMEHNPLSLTCKDNIGSSVFHYATEHCNYIILSRAISLLKRLSSSTARQTALQRLIEKNARGKTPFVIAIEKSSLKCVKQILSNKWVNRNVDIEEFINADSLKTTIDKDKLAIAAYFVSDTQRFAAIINIQIYGNDRFYNVLEYSIALKKNDFVRTFISVRIPSEEHELYRSYKSFLNHYNVPYSGSIYDQTPIQRMLTMPDMVPLVPLLLEQFISDDAIDLSIVDDCLRARPACNRCIFGRTKRFLSSDWLQQHPLSLIAEANYPPVYDHDVVRICVDLKVQLFGKFLYLLMLCLQILYVCLYTSTALASPIPRQSYYDTSNYTCQQLCQILTSDPIQPLGKNLILRTSRILLLIWSSIVLLKEVLQFLIQREKYFRDIFIRFLELQTHICALLFSIDLDTCTTYTGLRCKWQWECGALGIAGVWTLLLFVFMNSLKIGKYGLLFVSVFLTFLKFCLIYVLIWIGYIIAFYMLFIHKKPQFTRIFYLVPKTLAMLTGEYDFDDLFFPDGEVLQGSETALVVYSIFVFTMNIVIMNIMVGLAVSDVKCFRLNAKREHLRARIETCLGLQAKFGVLCETCSRLVIALSRHPLFLRFQMQSSQKYYLWKLELRKSRIDLPQTISDSYSYSSRISKCHSGREHVTCEVGYYRHHIDRAGEPLLQENENTHLMYKVDELRDVFEKANACIHQELRKLTVSLQTDFDEIKKKLLAS